MPLPAGRPAPDFSLPDENGDSHKLSEYQGAPVVLYFYPKDETEGCIKEACSFRDDYSAYEEAGVTILGVSPDSSKSHTKFKTKYNLPFTLLADTELDVIKMYDVWGPKKMFGREYEGVLRTTYLIGKSGEIIKVFEKVRPANHSAEILSALAELD